MVDFAALSELVKKRLDDDLEINSIEVEMPTLEESIHEAAATLGIPVRNLDYEILIRKTTFLSFGQNLCKIRAYESSAAKRKRKEEAEAAAAAAAAARAQEFADMELVEDLDGEVFVKRLADGVHIKVTAPVGEGERAVYNDAVKVLAAAKVRDYDDDAVKDAVKKHAGIYVRVGNYSNNPAHNSIMNVEISDDQMRAFLHVTPTGPAGADIMLEDIQKILSMNGVVAGISQEFLESFADKPIYKEKICVAKGEPAVSGMNSFMQYFFETDQSKIKLKESSDGRIDFKEMNIIENVRQGQKLAVWNPADRGRDGQTVTGRILMATPGKETAFDIGHNVHIDSDKITIIADVDGQVMLINGKINVEPLYEVAGDVGVKTGNIEFLGNVVVKGDIADGFKVKAAGNIDVSGTVNKATLIAGADIIVKQGIYGKEGMIIQAGRSVWAKFIENATVRSGNMVVVSDGIINSYVDADKRILCSGRRAKIVGGRVRAAEEINCKTLGAAGGSTETVCEVAFDPQSKEALEALNKEREQIAAEFDNINLNIRTLENQKKQNNFLPDDKEEFLQQLIERRTTTAQRIKLINEKSAEIQEHLSSILTIGKVSVGEKVYAGVVIIIRDVKEKVRNEYKAVSFVLRDGLIRTEKYTESPAAAVEGGGRKK
ncbi:MAG: FapA family protein [Spirochaetaceae bacterium]|nr:FapA family protein [Spirochaetaceae bacterium]